MKNETKVARELHIGRKFNYDKVNSYHAKFIDQETGKFAEKFTERRNCPVCSSKKFIHIFNASGGSYVRCKDCTMVFTNPVFTRSSLSLYYQNLNTGQTQIVDNESDFYREIYSMGLKFINKYATTGKILDVGCSGGFFLDVARENSWLTSGIELNLEESEMCRKRGHIVYTDGIELLDKKEKYDAITLWDVFEHIPDGKIYLDLLKSHLHEDGTIFMQTPNTDSLAAKIMREKCKMFDGVEHVNLYNPVTLKLVVESCGLKVVDMRTVISEIAVLNNYLSYDDPYFGYSNYGAKLMGFIDERQLHEELCGYKIQAVIRIGS